MMKRLLLALLCVLYVSTPTSATFFPSFIKSIQQGTITIANGEASHNATVSAVVVANSAVMGNIWSSQTASGTLVNGDLCIVQLMSTTLLTATRGQMLGAGSTDAGCSIGYTLVEFLPQFVKARSTSLTAIGATSTTAAATASIVAKSMCFYGGLYETNGGVAPGEAFGACWVSAVNTVTLKRGTVGDGSTSMAWTVLEFK